MKTTNKEDRNSKRTARGTLRQFSDEQLLIKYRDSGREQIFAALVARYQRELFNYLQRYLGSAAMAEDAFQTTFLQVLLKCDTFQEGRRFRPWLYTIATNQAIDLQRRNKRHQHVSLVRNSRSESSDMSALVDLLVGNEHDPADHYDLRERAEWIRDAVADLPDSLQQCVQLVYFQGMRYRDAAKQIGIPVGTVKSRLHTALSKLRESWAAENPLLATA